MAKAFSKVVERNALKPRRDPYWDRVQKGCYLGYRKMAKGSHGTWLARALIEGSGKQAHKALGDFLNVPDHLRFDEARREAKKWFDHLSMGGRPEIITICAVCERYVAHQRENVGDKAADDAKARFERWVYTDCKFSNMELGKLANAHVQAWRSKLKATPVIIGVGKTQLIRKRADGTINRDMTCLRAALNLAHKSGWATSDYAWLDPLKPMKNADKRRAVYLDLKQRRKLIKHAAKDVANFIRGMALLPLRPGALASLVVSNFNGKLKTITVGKDKHGADRIISLPDATAAFLATQAAKKAMNAPLLSRYNGMAWDKDAWKYPIKEAALNAGLPEIVTAYALRHSVITDLIHGGLDVLTTAQLSGTSAAMIEKHYFHLTAKQSTAALAKLKL